METGPPFMSQRDDVMKHVKKCPKQGASQTLTKAHTSEVSHQSLVCVCLNFILELLKTQGVVSIFPIIFELKKV